MTHYDIINKYIIYCDFLKYFNPIPPGDGGGGGGGAGEAFDARANFE